MFPSQSSPQPYDNFTPIGRCDSSQGNLSQKKYNESSFVSESSALLNNLSQDEIFESFHGQESPDLFPSQSSPQPYDNFTPVGRCDSSQGNLSQKKSSSVSESSALLNNLSQDEIVDGTEQPKIVSFTPIDSYLCSYDDDNIVQYLRNTNMKKFFPDNYVIKKNFIVGFGSSSFNSLQSNFESKYKNNHPHKDARNIFLIVNSFTQFHFLPTKSVQGRDLFRYTIPIIHHMISNLYCEGERLYQNDLFDFFSSKFGTELLVEYFNSSTCKISSKITDIIKSKLKVNVSPLALIQAKDESKMSLNQAVGFTKNTQTLTNERSRGIFKLFIGTRKLKEASAAINKGINQKLNIDIHEVGKSGHFVEIEGVIRLMILTIKEKQDIKNNKLTIRFSYDSRNVQLCRMAFFLVPLGYSNIFPCQKWTSAFPFLLYDGDEKMLDYFEYCDSILQFTCKEKQTVNVDNTEYTIKLIDVPDLHALFSSRVEYSFKQIDNLSFNNLRNLYKFLFEKAKNSSNSEYKELLKNFDDDSFLRYDDSNYFSLKIVVFKLLSLIGLTDYDAKTLDELKVLCDSGKAISSIGYKELLATRLKIKEANGFGLNIKFEDTEYYRSKKLNIMEYILGNEQMNQKVKGLALKSFNEECANNERRTRKNYINNNDKKSIKTS